jgi:hypothetical protein
VVRAFVIAFAYMVLMAVAMGGLITMAVMLR